MRHGKQKRRVGEINVLKSIAFLAVVFQSVLLTFYQQGNITSEVTVMVSFIYTFLKFSAPAFIFITGFILIYHHREHFHYKEFLIGKIADTYIPFLFWTLTYSALFVQWPNLDSAWGMTIISQVLLGTAAPHLWYVVMVFQFYLVFPLLLWMFKYIESKNKIKIGYIVIGVYFLLVWVFNTYIYDGGYKTEIVFLKYLDRSFLLYIFYFALGGFAALNINKWRSLIIKGLPWNSLLLLGSILWVMYEMLTKEGMYQISLTYATPLKPSMFILVTLQILIIYGFSMVVVNSRGIVYKTLNFIGKYTFGAYLAHYLFLKISLVIVEFFSIFSLAINSILLFALTTLFSVAFTQTVSRIPHADLVIGPFEKMKTKPAYVK